MVVGCGTSKVSELMVDNGGFTSIIRYFYYYNCKFNI